MRLSKFVQFLKQRLLRFRQTGKVFVWYAHDDDKLKTNFTDNTVFNVAYLQVTNYNFKNKTWCKKTGTKSKKDILNLYNDERVKPEVYDISDPDMKLMRILVSKAYIKLNMERKLRSDKNDCLMCKTLLAKVIHNYIQDAIEIWNDTEKKINALMKRCALLQKCSKVKQEDKNKVLCELGNDLVYVQVTLQKIKWAVENKVDIDVLENVEKN